MIFWETLGDVTLLGGGWTNSETWCLNLWVNKESWFLWLTPLANNPKLTDYQKCEVLKNEVEAANPIATNFSFSSNYRNNSFSCLLNCTTPTYANITPNNWLP